MSQRRRRERRTAYGFLVDPGLFDRFWTAAADAVWDVVAESVEVDAAAAGDGDDAWMEAHDRLVNDLADQIVFETITAALPFLNGAPDAFGQPDYRDKPLDGIEWRAVDAIYSWRKQPASTHDRRNSAPA